MYKSSQTQQWLESKIEAKFHTFLLFTIVHNNL